MKMASNTAGNNMVSRQHTDISSRSRQPGMLCRRPTSWAKSFVRALLGTSFKHASVEFISENGLPENYSATAARSLIYSEVSIHTATMISCGVDRVAANVNRRRATFTCHHHQRHHQYLTSWHFMGGMPLDAAKSELRWRRLTLASIAAVSIPCVNAHVSAA